MSKDRWKEDKEFWEQTYAALAEQIGKLRRLLWLNHARYIPGVHMPYGDDGEMQCCGIDFKRWTVDEIDGFIAARAFLPQTEQIVEPPLTEQVEKLRAALVESLIALEVIQNDSVHWSTPYLSKALNGQISLAISIGRSILPPVRGERTATAHEALREQAAKKWLKGA